ncbi:MAG TPA: response regulator transcription factor [Candidatus Binatia bacterium]|nr:response regulator transcription factor [Candidatus Binatia bacterium]
MKQEIALPSRKEPWLRSRPSAHKAIQLVIADDHPIVLDGLESLFALEKDMKVVARCGTGEESLAAVRKHRPDILLLDIRMPGKNIFEVIRELRTDNLPTRIVLLTAAIDDDEALEAVRLGVGGVVLKGMPPKLLIQCIRKVHAGERWMERGFLSHAVEKLVRREAGTRQVAKLLTPREIELVCMAASGLRNKEIGKKLFISEGTVKIHLHHIFEKLNVNSRHALTLYARNSGLV